GERLLEREPAGAPEEAALVPERAYDRREAREQEALDVEDVGDQPLPRCDPEAEDGERGDPVLRAATDAAHERPPRERLRDRAHSNAASSSTSSAPAAWSSSRTWVTSSKKRGSSRVAA